MQHVTEKQLVGKIESNLKNKGMGQDKNPFSIRPWVKKRPRKEDSSTTEERRKPLNTSPSILIRNMEKKSQVTQRVKSQAPGVKIVDLGNGMKTTMNVFKVSDNHLTFLEDNPKTQQ